MCGFVGIVSRAGRDIEPELLRRMGGVLAHRGPDGEGQYIADGVGLHHKRLAIIDPEHGQQPMSSDGVVVAYNGEIYNFVELGAELRQKGHPFRTNTDTEVLLRSYHEHGVGCLSELNGMFAFVLHDTRRRRVIAARDHFGIKPLYYCTTPDGFFLFASEIKALLVHPSVRAAVDAEALQDYLVFQYVLEDRTLFSGIRKLGPGCVLELDLVSGKIETTQYWDLSFKIDRHGTDQYFVDRLEWLLDDTVKQQLRSDVPVGTYLSGGLDSSVVTTLAARHYPGALKCFTGAFREGPEFDESPYAKMVADATGSEMFLVHPTQDEFIELLPELIYYMDEPAAGPGLFPQYIVSRLASKEVKVCLGGQGGDEIFGGYARYVVAYLEQALKGALFATNEEGEHIVSLASILPNLPAIRRYVPMLQSFWSDGLFEDMDRRYFRLVDRSGDAVEMYSADFRERFDREEVFARFQRVFNHPDTQSYYNKMTHFDMQASLPALLHVEDRVSMANSLESRVPLLDRRIAELAASMWPAMKFKGGDMKHILKRTTRTLLPQQIVDRKDKMGFPVPLHLWARDRARDFFGDVLLSRACRERGLFDMQQVEALMTREAPFGRRLWGLLNIELWHRRFIDGA